MFKRSLLRSRVVFKNQNMYYKPDKVKIRSYYAFIVLIVFQNMIVFQKVGNYDPKCIIILLLQPVMSKIASFSLLLYSL